MTAGKPPCGHVKFKEKTVQYQSFGLKIRLLRKQNVLTQGQLSAQFGRSQAYISQLEAGFIKPNHDIIKKLCVIFNLYSDYFNDCLPINFIELPFDIGPRILKLRLARRLDQQDMAKLLNISTYVLRNIERGDTKPSDEVIHFINLWLRPPKDWLTSKTTDDPQYDERTTIAAIYGARMLSLPYESRLKCQSLIDHEFKRHHG